MDMPSFLADLRIPLLPIRRNARNAFSCFAFCSHHKQITNAENVAWESPAQTSVLRAKTRSAARCVHASLGQKRLKVDGTHTTWAVSVLQ
jgi:hypothetical protein